MCNHGGPNRVLTIRWLDRKELTAITDERGHLFWELLPNQTAGNGLASGDRNSAAKRLPAGDTGACANVGMSCVTFAPNRLNWTTTLVVRQTEQTRAAQVVGAAVAATLVSATVDAMWILWKGCCHPTISLKTI